MRTISIKHLAAIAVIALVWAPMASASEPAHRSAGQAGTKAVITVAAPQAKPAPQNSFKLPVTPGQKFKMVPGTGSDLPTPKMLPGTGSDPYPGYHPGPGYYPGYTPNYPPSYYPPSQPYYPPSYPSYPTYTQYRLGINIGGYDPYWGVYVQYVHPGSAAERVGIEAGDWILSVNGQQIRSYADVQRLIAYSNGYVRCAIFDKRLGVTQFRSIRLDPIYGGGPVYGAPSSYGSQSAE